MTAQDSKRVIPTLSAADANSARLFGQWLKQHRLTIDQFSNDSGVGRSTVSALAGTMGANAQTRWSGIRRPTLERIYQAVSAVEPMTTRQLAKMLAVDPDSRPAVWSPAVALTGGRLASTTVLGVPLAVSWDCLIPGGPHVAQGPAGELAVYASEVPPGWERLGRLTAITPGD